MKRTEWLVRLEQELTRAGVARTAEILADYEEHFAAATEAGKSEEEVAEKLGDPKAVTKAHLAESLVTKATRPDGRAADVPTIMSATLRLLLLTPFTFFMLIGPFLIVSVFILIGWMLTIAFGGISVGALALLTLGIPFLLVNFWGAGSFIFGILAFVSATVLAAMTMWVATKWVLQMFVSYLRWNVDFVLEK